MLTFIAEKMEASIQKAAGVWRSIVLSQEESRTGKAVGRSQAHIYSSGGHANRDLPGGRRHYGAGLPKMRVLSAMVRPARRTLVLHARHLSESGLPKVQDPHPGKWTTGQSD